MADEGSTPPYDPRRGPDLRYERRAADIVRDLTSPDSWWRRRSAADRSPTYVVADCYVTGELSLRGAELDTLLHFERCRFERPPDVREARLLGLTFDDCVLPGLRARNLHCRNDLRLHSTDVELAAAEHLADWEPGVPDAAVVLTDAVVDGSVVLTRSKVRHPHGKALQADRLRVAGAVTAYHMAGDGEVRFAGMRTGGNVNFSGSQLNNPEGIALNVTGVQVHGSLLCESDPGVNGYEEPRPFTANGMVFVPGASVDGDFRLANALLSGQRPGTVDDIAIPAWREAARSNDPSVDPWPAVVGDRLRVQGNVVFDWMSAEGTIRLVNVAVGGSFRMNDASIDAPGRHEEPHYDRALHLDGSEISGDLQVARLQAQGQLRLADVRIGGNLRAREVGLHHRQRDVFSARRAMVSGNVEMNNAEIMGTVQFQGAQVGGSVDFSGASLTDYNPAAYSMGMRAATVGRDLVLAGSVSEEVDVDGTVERTRKPFVARGGLNLDGVQVARTLNLDGASLGDLKANVALDASDAMADEFRLTVGEQPQGRVILRRAQCGSLADNETLWAASGEVDVEDFRYDALDTPIDPTEDDAREEVRKRVNWLRKAMRGYRPGPYDQLAEVLRSSGNEEHAATVLMLKQRDRYEAMADGSKPLVAFGLRLWSGVQRVVVGYGYKPMRALGWLVLLLILGSLWFWLVPDSCVHNPRFTVSGPRCLVNADDTGLEWNPVLHTADLLIPIVDLGNKGRWHMSGVDKWVATGFIAAGWILATTVAAGITRMLNRS